MDYHTTDLLDRLPVTDEEFKTLVEKVYASLVFDGVDTEREHIAAVISQRIQHLPPEKAYETVKYFKSCVIKNMAYQLAVSQSSKLNHKHQIEQIESYLATNPNDQQAIDQLEKAAKDGSELARTALEKFLMNKPTSLEQTIQ